MPPAGVKKGSKRARQYEHIKEWLKEQGRSEDTAEEIAARTVNKERARHGESKTASKTSTKTRCRRASAADGAGNAPREGPHARPAVRRGEAQERQGPLSMTKAQLERAVDRWDDLRAGVQTASRSSGTWTRRARKLVRVLAETRSSSRIRVAAARPPFLCR